MDKRMILFACFIGTLSICWKNTIPLTPVELGNLDWCNATRRPACSSDAYLFATSGFIHKNKLISGRCMGWGN